MAPTTTRPEPKGAAPATALATQDRPDPSKPRESYRDTVEAIVVAFILALLVRGFEAEAFVIPTGSMAPTLMGRHKEITCPQCRYVYAVNASEETEGGSSGSSSLRVAAGVCVNCRYQAKVADEPSFKGDRILVMKFPYDLPSLPGSSDPRRWDVVVFRYPEEPEVSYIKRLVGLPGETLRIWYGDIFIKPPGGTEFRLERKPLEHQRAMQMTVYDDTHRPAALKDKPEWRRWVAGSPNGWSEAADRPGTFAASPTGDTWAELRYRHVVPDPGQWRAIDSGEALPRPPRPTLITDFYSYNTNLKADHSDEVFRDQDSAWFQPHWVGDLTVTGRVDVEGPAGSLRLELIEGGVSNRCEVDLASGTAEVFHGPERLGRFPTTLKGAGSYDVAFANVDNRLTLWVDGRPAFGEGVRYEDEPGHHPEPTAEDLAPVRIGVKGGKVRVSDLVLTRDIYYTLNPGAIDYGNPWDSRMPRTAVELFDLLADPAKVAALGPLNWSSDYPIGPDRFMMLGDNSPRSKDSRGWGLADRYSPADPDGTPESGWDPSGREKWEVPRSLLTGKAFCIYWPHGKPFGPDIRVGPDFRIPFRPYLERMKLIH
jgi:signal peptidase I